MSVRAGWILLCLTVGAAPLVAQVPGWRVTADSQVTLDTSITHSGHGSGHLRGLSPEDFQNLRQGLSPDSLRGHRVRFSAWVRTNLVEGTAGLWMRVDGEGMTDILAFDNMSTRPIQGTTSWTRYEIVLDVPRGSAAIVLGILMVGQGDVWLDDVVVEPVGADVASTDMVALLAAGPSHEGEEITQQDRERILASRRAAPLRLRNPDFEQRP